MLAYTLEIAKRGDKGITNWGTFQGLQVGATGITNMGTLKVEAKRLQIGAEISNRDKEITNWGKRDCCLNKLVKV